MKSCIFIKTCPKDYPWLKFCLQSIGKYVSGFDEIILVSDENGRQELETWGLTAETVHFVEPSHNGYIQQQIVKLQADTYTDAELIVYVDSDCLFFRPCTPDDFLRDGRPILIKRRYGNIGIAEKWKALTEEVLGGEVEWEYMERVPIAFHRDTLPAFRDAYPQLLGHLEKKEGRLFSEFNALGAFAERDHPGKYHFADIDSDAPDRLAVQFWSWGGFSPEILGQIHAILSDRREAVRYEPSKQDFVNTWGVAGYRENFDVYSRPDQGGKPESEVVEKCLAPFFNRDHVCLDIGCGGGFWEDRYLCDQFKHVIGIDVVPTGGVNRANFTFIEVPCRNYDCYGIDEESIDFIWSFGVFCHIPLHAVQAYLRSAFRVLKPGGKISAYFSNTERRPGAETTVELTEGGGIIWADNDSKRSKQMMEAAGFVNIHDPIPDLRDTVLTAEKPCLS